MLSLAFGYCSAVLALPAQVELLQQSLSSRREAVFEQNVVVLVLVGLLGPSAAAADAVSGAWL